MAKLCCQLNVHLVPRGCVGLGVGLSGGAEK
jgi:hypothetical protein